MAITAAAALMLTPVCPTLAKDRDDAPPRRQSNTWVVIFQENVSFDH